MLKLIRSMFATSPTAPASEPTITVPAVKPEPERDSWTGKEVKFLLPETRDEYFRRKAEYELALGRFPAARKAEYDRLMAEAAALDVESSESPAADELRRRKVVNLRREADEARKRPTWPTGEEGEIERKLRSLLDTLRREEAEKILTEGDLVLESTSRSKTGGRFEEAGRPTEFLRKVVIHQNVSYLLVWSRGEKGEWQNHGGGEMSYSAFHGNGQWEEEFGFAFSTSSVGQMTDDELRAVEAHS